MTGLEDHQCLSRDIDAAHAAGARLHLACEIAGIDVRTPQRWKAQQGLAKGDGRSLAVRPIPAHALSPAERAELLRVANEPRFADVPPTRIVPVCWQTKREGLVVGGIGYRLQVPHLKLCASRAFWLVAYPSQGHEMLFDAFNGKPQAFTER